jgi:hypothetical protein
MPSQSPREQPYEIAGLGRLSRDGVNNMGEQGGAL